MANLERNKATGVAFYELMFSAAPNNGMFRRVESER